MATSMKSTLGGITDRRKSTSAGAVSGTTFLGTTPGTPVNYFDITKLRARLTTLNAGRYTSSFLDIMTLNDMWYALRTLDDTAGI